MKKQSLRSRVASKLKQANETGASANLSKRERQFAPKLSRSPRAGFTPELLQGQRSKLRSTALVPAMPKASHSDHAHISLLRRKGQSAEQFTDFMVDTRRALHTIDSKPKGQKLLTDLNAAPNTSRFDNHSTVVIQDARLKPKKGNTAAPEPEQFIGSMNAYRMGTERNSDPGTGLASHVSFNPDTITPRLDSGVTDGSRPSFIGLAHELVHSSRQQKGLALDPTMTLDKAAEEVETVGMVQGPNSITENSIRSEHGISERTTYGGENVARFNQMLEESGMKEDY